MLMDEKKQSAEKIVKVFRCYKARKEQTKKSDRDAMYEHFDYFEKMRLGLKNDSQRVIVEHWKRFKRAKKMKARQAA